MLFNFIYEKNFQYILPVIFYVTVSIKKGEKMSLKRVLYQKYNKNVTLNESPFQLHILLPSVRVQTGFSQVWIE